MIKNGKEKQLKPGTQVALTDDELRQRGFVVTKIKTEVEPDETGRPGHAMTKMRRERPIEDLLDDKK